MQSCPKVSKHARIKNRYKTQVKTHSTRRLCTCVRARSVFLTLFYQKTCMSREHLQSITFWDDNVDFRLGLLQVLEALQNRSEKSYSANRSAQFEL